jgi:hybrid cluster-associated redox disulfide protein
MNEKVAQLTPRLDMTVAELLEHWPACANVLNERRMACVGCELSAFETLAAAARVYQINEDQLLKALTAAAVGCRGHR